MVTPQPVTAPEVIDDTLEVAEMFGSALEDFLDRFEFYGRTLRDWIELQRVDLPEPDDIDPATLTRLLVIQARNYQQAVSYHHAAAAVHKALSSGGGVRRDDLVTSLVRSYEQRNAKRPGEKVLERVAGSYMKQIEQPLIVAKIIVDFWKERRDAMIELRKTLEQIGMSMGMQLKYLDR